MLRRACVVAVLLVVVALTPACGGDGDRLTIYSGRTENLVGPLLKEFSEETGIGIDVRYGDSADLALLIDQEGDRSPADVFLSQSPGAIGYLATKGRLRPLPAGLLDRVDDRFASPDGTWVGLSGRIRVLVYNTDLVDADELPASVLDLTGDEYRGRVAVAPANGSFQDFVSGLRSALGDDEALEWLRGMRANRSPSYANNLAIVQAVARGEVPMGLVNHYYNERQLAEDPRSPTANHIFPDGDVGAMLLVTAAGILDTSDQHDTADRDDAAARFVRFLLSDDAQRFFSGETFEYPLAAGVEPAVDLPALADIETPRVDFDDLGDDLATTRSLIERSGLEG